MKNFLEMPDNHKKKIIKEAVHKSNWAQVKVLYKKDLDKEIQKARISFFKELVGESDYIDLDGGDIEEILKQLENRNEEE